MTRQELLQSPAYWGQMAQMEIYQLAIDYMQEHGMNRSQLATHLGVSKGYVTQILSGEYNYSLQKLIELSIKLGHVLQLQFSPIESVVFRDANTNIKTSGRMVTSSPKVTFYNLAA